MSDKLKETLNKLVRSCHYVGLIAPFSPWEKGWGRGA